MDSDIEYVEIANHFRRGKYCLCLLLQHQVLFFFGITCADVGQVKLFHIGLQSQLGGIGYGRMEHAFRCLFIACRKGCFIHQNICILRGAYCLRTDFGIAEDSRYSSFFRRGGTTLCCQ